MSPLPAWRSLLFVPVTSERFVAKAHTRGAVAATAARASALRSGTIESSRSRMIASAPRVWALATKRSDVTGTNSSERQAGGGLIAVIP